MKQLLLLLLLINSNLFAQKFINEDEEHIDFSNNDLNLKVENESFIGNFEFVKVGFREYILIKNDNKILIVDYGISKPSNYSNDFYIEDVILINSNDINSLKKTIEKKRTLIDSKIDIKYEGKKDSNKYGNKNDHYKPYWGKKMFSLAYLEKQKAKDLEKEKRIKNYNEKTELNNFIGTYNILISNYNGIQLPIKKEAKLIITNEGVSILTDLEDTGSLRGTHFKDDKINQPQKGAFYCKTSNFPWDYLMFVIDEKSGAVTCSTNKLYKTTTFTIIEKLN